MMVIGGKKLQQIPASDRSMLLAGGVFLTGVLFVQSPEATLTPGISGRN
jgi:type II secretory pathway component PulM